MNFTYNNNILYNKLNTNFVNDFNTNTQVLILESNKCDMEITTLHQYILSNHNKTSFYFNILIILFHIIYTLKIFNLLGIKHNDLHFGNILIIYDKEKNKKTSNNKYIISDDDGNGKLNSKEYVIPNIGITTRLFDFDLASKNEAKDITKLKEGLNENIKGFNQLDYTKDYFPGSFLNNLNDIEYDILKIIYSVIMLHAQINNNNILKLINKLFDIPKILDKIKIIGSNPYTFMLNFIVNNITADETGSFKSTSLFKLKTVNEILDILEEEINKTSPTPIEKFNVVETYSMLNMYKKEYLPMNINHNTKSFNIFNNSSNTTTRNNNISNANLNTSSNV